MRHFPRTPYYILDGRIPVPCDDAIAYAEWQSTHDMTVAETQIGETRVSTVFLGICGYVPPELFETLCRGGPFDGFEKRYFTWEEAEQGHQDMVAMVTLWRLVTFRRGFRKMVRRLFRVPFVLTR